MLWDATRVCVSERGRICNLSCRPLALDGGVICWLVSIASTYAVSLMRTKAVMVTEANMVRSWIHYPVPSSIITTARHGSPRHQLTGGCFGLNGATAKFAAWVAEGVPLRVAQNGIANNLEESLRGETNENGKHNGSPGVEPGLRRCGRKAGCCSTGQGLLAGPREIDTMSRGRRRM